MLDQDSGVSPRRSASVSRPGPFGVGEHLLEHEGVDVHERGLEEVHSEHRDFLAFAVGAGEL